MTRWLFPLASAFIFLMPAWAQLAPPNEAGVTLGQIHLIAKDVEAQKHFWISMIGGKLVKNGSLELIEFPGVYITISQGDPLGPAAGSVIDHFGFIFQDVPGIQAWYKNAFGLAPGQRARVARVGWVDCDFVPGGNLSFVDQGKRLAPTKGRGVDHLGFEVRDIDTFVKKLEAQGIKLDTPVHPIPGTKIKSAFLTDPWGTYIEITEGLAP